MNTILFVAVAGGFEFIAASAFPFCRYINPMVNRLNTELLTTFHLQLQDIVIREFVIVNLCYVHGIGIHTHIHCTSMKVNCQ